jgi:hypothetical protein
MHKTKTHKMLTHDQITHLMDSPEEKMQKCMTDIKQSKLNQYHDGQKRSKMP